MLAPFGRTAGLESCSELRHALLAHPNPVVSVRARVLAAIGEPLTWMLLLGGLFFALDRAWRAPDARRVVVDAAVVRALELDHARRVGKPPTAREREQAIERWIDEEVRVREAERLGLARGDVIVRRRLVQKVDIVLDETTRLDPHAPPRVVPVERVTVEHVFLSRARPSVDSDAQAVLAALRQGREPGSLGDPFPHGGRLAERTETELGAVLGGAARELWRQRDGEWHGPLAGAAGVHVARVVTRAIRDEPAPGVPDQDAARRAAIARLRAGYVVEVRR
ncbi:MAG: hypothetical protein IT374_13675 [Polyangiaceae bacterium]|nr:hypothetical protein [Polyangiaceae bacterium]